MSPGTLQTTWPRFASLSANQRVALRWTSRKADLDNQETELALAFADAWDPNLRYKIRSLQYRSLKWYSPKELFDLLVEIVPKYNDFDVRTVRLLLAKFPVKIQPAREYSPALYLKGKPEVLQEILTHQGRLGAGEATIQSDGTLRLWWD